MGSEGKRRYYRQTGVISKRATLSPKQRRLNRNEQR
jgi:hypothetical protein